MHEKISICMWYHNYSVALDVKDVGIINPLYNHDHAFGDHFFCDTNELWFKRVCHILYKPLQDCDYRPKTFTTQPFYAKIKVPID
jgi:hypothetical protein